MFGITEVMLMEMQLVLIASVVGDRRDFLIDFSKPFSLDPIPRLYLTLYQIRDVDDLRNLCIGLDVGQLRRFPFKSRR